MSRHTIRAYVREVLMEKKFSDYNVPKGTWSLVPAGDLANHTPEIDIDDEIYNLVSTAYEPIGGNIKIGSPTDLPGKYTFFDVVDVDDDPEPDAVVFGKVRGSNLKVGGMGHDGGSGKRVSMSRLMQIVNRPGTFAEVSGAPAEIMLAQGMPVITDPDKVRQITGKDIEWVGKHPVKDYGPGTEGWYKQSYGGSSHLKTAIGSV